MNLRKLLHIGKDKNSAYHGTLETNKRITLKYEVSVREKTESEERASKLLKKATQKKYENDFRSAISCLREAYGLIAQSATSYPIATFLRLPLFLQQDGRYSESMAEFQKLLDNTPAKIAKEFSHASALIQKGLIASDRAQIFDKIRLAAQREKQFADAVYYQVLSDANSVISLKLQERVNEDDLDSYKTQKYSITRITHLLKKAHKESLSEVLTNKWMVFMLACDRPALEKLATDVAALLNTNDSLRIFKTDNKSKMGQNDHTRSDEYLQWLGHAIRMHIMQARQAWKDGNYDFARQEYQKTAYAITQIQGYEWAKEKFKEEQAQFAKSDPLYNEVISFVKREITKNPGVLQTGIYDIIPYEKRDIGYALYFGALLNDIRREKKGRTYALNLPRTTDGRD